MIVHSPINELFDPSVWEYWAILLALGGMIAFGSVLADSEDKARLRRRQQRRRPKLSQPLPRRQRAISYEVGAESSPRPPRPASPPPRRKRPPSA